MKLCGGKPKISRYFDLLILNFLWNLHSFIFSIIPSLINCYIIIILESCIHASDGCCWWCNGKEIAVLIEPFKHCEVKDKLIQIFCLRYLLVPYLVMWKPMNEDESVNSFVNGGIYVWLKNLCYKVWNML